MYFRTDLALEETQQLPHPLPGISSTQTKAGSLNVHIVEVQTAQAAQQLRKPVGRYITVETPPLSGSALPSQEDISAAAQQLSPLLPQEGTVLVVGLGNTDITPDALGPDTAAGVLATRHLTGEVAKSTGLDNLRGVAVLAPGVMGQTGIESGEIIAGVVEQIQPCAVIAIDALAARSASRIGCTLQFSNSGITPGAGVHNARKELCQQTLGVPVISVGIPTVVDAATLASDLLYGQQEPDPQVRALFEPRGAKMMVTPREIDLVIERGSRFLSAIINTALQPSLSLEDISYLMA